MKTTLLFQSIILASIIHSPLWASANDTTCYRIPVENLQIADLSEVPTFETWCYQKLNDPEHELFIYNADESNLKPELSLLKDRSGDVTHGSLLHGQISYHRAPQSFNPYSIPLIEPVYLPQENVSNLKINALSVDRVFSQLLSHSKNPSINFMVTPGNWSASVASGDLPFRGYWWPERNYTIVPSMRKYDSVALATTGSAGQSVNWELSHHRWSGASWEGHCNGWAAAAVLRNEPRTPKFNAATGLTFSVSDQKALLTEKDYCAHATFFGHRYNNSGDNRSDVRPQDFHRALVYYIGSLRKPVAMDYNSGVVVDNHVISGYTMNITRQGSNSYLVNANLAVHRYDLNIIEAPGIAPVYNRNYRYILYVDGSGNPVNGTWLTGNPDFLWVPLSTGQCANGNPYITEDLVQKIIYQ